MRCSLLLSLIVSGCGAGWQRVELDAVAKVPPRQAAQLWSRNGLVQLHGLIITRDWISGVPVLEPPSCDSCRVTIPRAEVDSVRFGSPEDGAALAIVGAGFVALIWYIYVRCLYTYCGGT